MLLLTTPKHVKHTGTRTQRRKVYEAQQSERGGRRQRVPISQSCPSEISWGDRASFPLTFTSSQRPEGRAVSPPSLPPSLGEDVSPCNGTLWIRPLMTPHIKRELMSFCLPPFANRWVFLSFKLQLLKVAPPPCVIL